MKYLKRRPNNNKIACERCKKNQSLYYVKDDTQPREILEFICHECVRPEDGKVVKTFIEAGKALMG